MTAGDFRIGGRLIAVGALALSLTSLSATADSLRDIYELALENDAQLKAEEAIYLARRETEVLSRSQLLPQVVGSYSFQNTDTDTEGPNFVSQPGQGIAVGEVKTNQDIDNEGYAISLNQALFDLPAWFSFQSGKEVTKEAEATFAANQQNLIVRVVDTYLAVLRAQDNLSASKAAERAFERQLEQTQQRFEVGLIAITDVYEAQAARDLSQVERIEDENDVLVALERLSVLTGQRHNNLNILEEDFAILPPDPTDRAAWVEFALSNNFELAAARYSEEAARQSAKANKYEHAPKLTGSYEYSDFDADGSVSSDPSNNLNIAPDTNTESEVWGLTLSMPLYAGGAISSNRRKAAQDFNASREQRINLTRNTVTNTRSLHMTVMSNVTRVAARKQSIVSSKSALDATQAGYEVGTRNVVDVLNAQNAVFSAERDYANSRYDYVVSLLRLKEQAGLLSPEDIIRLDSFLVPPAPAKASEDEE